MYAASTSAHEGKSASSSSGYRRRRCRHPVSNASRRVERRHTHQRSAAEPEQPSEQLARSHPERVCDQRRRPVGEHRLYVLQRQIPLRQHGFQGGERETLALRLPDQLLQHRHRRRAIASRVVQQHHVPSAVQGRYRHLLTRGMPPVEGIHIHVHLQITERLATAAELRRCGPGRLSVSGTPARNSVLGPHDAVCGQPTPADCGSRSAGRSPDVTIVWFPAM